MKAFKVQYRKKVCFNNIDYTEYDVVYSQSQDFHIFGEVNLEIRKRQETN